MFEKLWRFQLVLTTEFTEEDGKPRVNWWRNTRKGNHLVAGVGVGTMRNLRTIKLIRRLRIGSRDDAQYLYYSIDYGFGFDASVYCTTYTKHWCCHQLWGRPMNLVFRTVV
jgi:hypothetical protein